MVWLAVLAWARGTTTIAGPAMAEIGEATTRYEGQWITLAVALGTLAALLLLDAGRQVLLAIPARQARGRE